MRGMLTVWCALHRVGPRSTGCRVPSSCGGRRGRPLRSVDDDEPLGLRPHLQKVDMLLSGALHDYGREEDADKEADCGEEQQQDQQHGEYELTARGQVARSALTRASSL